MSEQGTNEPKKISLAEAMKQKLAQKKQEQMSGGKQQGFTGGNGNQKMKNQNNAKKIMTKRKMGG